MNPAILSSGIASLFPADVAAAELRTPGDAAFLMSAEAEYLGHSVPKRIQEFAAGRACARRALGEFGWHDFPLRVAPDRRPLWPENIVGSITHTAGLCAAVVGEAGKFLGLGLDSEIVGHVTPDIWGSICTGEETRWLETLAVDLRASAITLVFAAKEAFYKCQYPVTREWLDFHDLSIEPVAFGSGAGEFLVRATRPIAVADSVRLPQRGRYRFHEGFVSVGIALNRDAAGQ